MAAATPVRIRVTAAAGRVSLLPRCFHLVQPPFLLTKLESGQLMSISLFEAPYFPTLCRASGAMDNASDYGSEDSRFDSWLARYPL